MFISEITKELPQEFANDLEKEVYEKLGELKI